jgi:hypothetical protein
MRMTGETLRGHLTDELRAGLTADEARDEAWVARALALGWDELDVRALLHYVAGFSLHLAALDAERALVQSREQRGARAARLERGDGDPGAYLPGDECSERPRGAYYAQLRWYREHVLRIDPDWTKDNEHDPRRRRPAPMPEPAPEDTPLTDAQRALRHDPSARRAAWLAGARVLRDKKRAARERVSRAQVSLFGVAAPRDDEDSEDGAG